MSPSVTRLIPGQCGRWCWVQTVIIMVGLAFMGWLAIIQPLNPELDAASDIHDDDVRLFQ